MSDVMDLIPRAGELVTEDLPQGSDAWLRARRTGVGGSEVAAILGLSPWQTPMTLWATKMGHGEATPTLAMLMGSETEPGVRHIWESWEYDEATRGMRRRATPYQTSPVPFLRDAAHPHRVASLDGIVTGPGDPGVLEIKTSRQPWDELPVYYALQVLHYLAMTGLPRGVVVVSCGANSLHEYPVAADPELMGEVYETVDAFWRDYVMAGVEPPPQTVSERTTTALARLQRNGQTLCASPEVTQVVLGLRQAEAAKEALVNGIEEAKAQIAEAMAASGVARFLGEGWVASMVERKGSVKYAEAVRALGIPQETLEQYRGEPSRYVTIRDVRGSKEDA